jgi:hypothetical protein
MKSRHKIAKYCTAITFSTKKKQKKKKQTKKTNNNKKTTEKRGGNHETALLEVVAVISFSEMRFQNEHGQIWTLIVFDKSKTQRSTAMEYPFHIMDGYIVFISLKLLFFVITL